jgi:DNA-binding response OmpR family regulator
MQPSILKPAAPQDNEKFRVLIVEDDVAVARLLMSSLTAVNIECTHAADGVSGLELFYRQNHHLVVLDLGLPRLPGNQVCAKIRENSTVPIIMLTAMDATDQQLQSFKLGADDYVAKPFSPKLLVARVVANLRRAYRYDACQGMENVPVATDDGGDRSAPAGWATCDRCGYMGPREKFDHEDVQGRRTIRCPVCKESDYIVFSVG